MNIRGSAGHSTTGHSTPGRSDSSPHTTIQPVQPTQPTQTTKPVQTTKPTQTPHPVREEFKYKPQVNVSRKAVDSYISSSTSTHTEVNSIMENDVIVFDKKNKEWKLVKESERYKYKF